MSLAMITVVYIDKTLRQQYKELNQRDNNVSAQIFDTLSNITTVIILRIEKLLSKEILKKIIKPYDLYRKNIRLNEFKWFLASLFINAMVAWILIGYILRQYNAGSQVLAGTIYILYGYANNIGGQFFRLAGRYGDIVRWNSALESIKPIEEEFKQKEEAKLYNFKKDWKELNIKNLSFSYEEDGKVRHLVDVNLNIKKGQKIAFIGESGSGKSTMFKLIRGLYNPENADISIDGNKVQSLQSISESVTLIPQEPEIFVTTVKKNVTMGISYDDKTVKRYIKLSKFDIVLPRLPKGIETNVMEKGVSLSGGEKQRLALARGLLAIGDSEIILLDEPTSSVDSKNESEIYDNIFNEFEGKTIMAAVHKLNLLHNFDYIYHFRNGVLIEEGTLEEMKKTAPVFRHIWEKYHRKHLVS
jgi:ABC-type multidrug transport system fused ATPase/permease subunit